MTYVRVLVLALAAALPRPGQAFQPAAAACATAAACRTETEAAIAAGDLERAHDLAWRAVQHGPRNDPGLMFLLARAQALSGRADDALVMLGRIAGLGVAPDASGDEFRRTRSLRGWPAVEDAIARAAAAPLPATPGAPVPPPAPEVSPHRPAVPVDRGEPAERARAAEPAEPAESATLSPAGSFSEPGFVPGGLACDAVSGRFVFGDTRGRKLQIVAEGGTQSIDLTRQASAGFQDVLALDIDTLRGDLWVTSADASGGTASLHKLQLVSGRSLAVYSIPGAAGPWPVDVAVLRSGAVLVLDAAQRTVFVLRPRAAALDPLVDLGARGAVSLAAAGDDVVYLAGAGGIWRLDVRQRRVAEVKGRAGLVLAGIEHIDWQGGALVAVQALPDGRRRLARIVLDAAGRAAVSVHVVDVALPPVASPVMTAACGDGVAVLARASPDGPPGLDGGWTFTRVRFAR